MYLVTCHHSDPCVKKKILSAVNKPWLFCWSSRCWWWWPRWESSSGVLVPGHLAPPPPTAHGQAWRHLRDMNQKLVSASTNQVSFGQSSVSALILGLWIMTSLKNHLEISSSCLSGLDRSKRQCFQAWILHQDTQLLTDTDPTCGFCLKVFGFQSDCPPPQTTHY